MTGINYCWICGSEANSREHKHKKSIVKKLFYSKGKALEHPYLLSLDGKGILRPQGPESKYNKYEKSLCQACNCERSKPWDSSYDLLANWCLKSSERYSDIAQIDFTQIYGKDYIEGLQNLYRYLAKSLGCRLIEDNVELPDNFPNPLLDSEISNFKISINQTHNALFLSLLKENPDIDPTILEEGKGLSKGSMLVNYCGDFYKATRKIKPVEVVCWETIGHFQINYWLNIDANPEFGYPLDCQKQVYKVTQKHLDIIDLKKTMGEWLEHKFST